MPNMPVRLCTKRSKHDGHTWVENGKRFWCPGRKRMTWK